MFSWQSIERKGSKINVFQEPCYHEEEYMNNIFHELQGSSKYDIHDGPEGSMAVIKLIGNQLQLLNNMYDGCVTSHNSISNCDAFFTVKSRAYSV